ncbi:MAG: hypothetical protein ACAI38_21405 [Myxococcota bacterium]|nr:hypothetical protein [Myxococcota bacterium]
MTIRIRPITVQLDDDREMAAHLTPTLLGSLKDDAPDGTAHAKPGTAWLRWSSAKPQNPGLD